VTAVGGGLRRSLCRTCHAAIIWAVSESGTRCPIDAEPVGHGNIVLTVRPQLAPLARVLSAGEQVLAPTYTNHFATCPDAPAWRHR
jgi:hypothetical protein